MDPGPSLFDWCDGQSKTEVARQRLPISRSKKSVLYHIECHFLEMHNSV
jgi:hypothetical protein